MTAKEQGLLRECFSCGTIHGGALCCGPIERDPKMERDYIPMPGGWEIQTKGKGSTFRICDKDGDRLAIPDSPYLHETLERMARDVNAAALASDTGERGVVDGWARTKLRAHEAACESCGRAVWDGKDQANCIGFLATCGKRVARVEDCGTVDCIAALRAQPAGGGDSMREWSVQMAAKEAEQTVTAGAHGIPDEPSPPESGGQGEAGFESLMNLVPDEYSRDIAKTEATQAWVAGYNICRNEVVANIRKRTLTQGGGNER